MAIKASNQVDLIDLTDGYSVHLTNDNYTFLGNTASVEGTQSMTCKIMALCGGDQVPCTIGKITTLSGISAVSDGKVPEPTITITATAALTTPGVFTIPVVIGEITINKVFSYAIAFRGTNGSNGSNGANGANGTNGANGKDAINLVITSSAGVIFKNTAVATTLTAHVYKGGSEVTGSAASALGEIRWYKDSGTAVVATGATLNVTAGVVTNKATYTAQLEG